MKTLVLSDEDYDFLKDCVNELKTQNNRSTRCPLYTVHATKKIYGIDTDYTGEYTYIWDDDDMGSIEDVFKFMLENGYEEDLLKMFNHNNPLELDSLSEENLETIREWFCDSINSYEVVEAMKEFTGYTFSEVGISMEDRQVTDGACFSFFEKDAFDHIEMNKHNIRGSNVHTYADALYRTPRMEKLLKLLHKLEFQE